MDLKSILNDHKSKHASSLASTDNHRLESSFSLIPDVFFDDVLVKFKLTRLEILALVYLYRKAWAPTNVDRKYGMTPHLDYKIFSQKLEIESEHLMQTLRKLEEFGFVQKMNHDLYFVRKYFTEELDKRYGQNYENSL